MRLAYVSRFVCVLGVLTLGASHPGITLEEWSLDPKIPVLGSSESRYFVAPPKSTVPPYAYSRFSLSSAFTRVSNSLYTFPSSHGVEAGTKYVPVSSLKDADRTRTLSDDVIANVTDPYRSGMVYLWSLGGVPRDFEKAYEYFHIAATKKEDADASFMLGVFHATGFFFTRPEPDFAKAQLYYELASRAGSIEAMLALGFRFAHGINGAPRDATAAARTLEEAGSIYSSYIQRGMSHMPTSPRFLSENSGFSYVLRPVNRNSGAFGAEANTGLYGKHNYRVRANPTTLESLSMGERSTASKFVQTQFSEAFETLEEAYDTLVYRATDEHDARSMFGLALVFKYGASSASSSELGDVDWDAVATFAQMCEKTIRDQEDITSYGLTYTACTALLGECYLWGEGRPTSTEHARYWFKRAINASIKATGQNSCVSCASGSASCSILEAENAVEAQEASLRFETNHVGTGSTIDANIANALFMWHLSNGDIEAARKISSLSSQSTTGREPMTSSNLAFLSEPVNAKSSAKQIGEDYPEDELIDSVRDSQESTWWSHPHASKLEFLQQAFAASESLSTPIDFAQYSYDTGDLESAVIAFAVSAELGVGEAQINLADIFDVRHSYLGASKTFGSRWPFLRALAEWPLPHFIVKHAATVDRAQSAVRYFARAAASNSVDASAKLVEYGWHYGSVPAPLVEEYLTASEKHNMALGHWWRGQMFYSMGDYKRALDRFSRTLVNPDAWMPAKFSQFLTALHSLRGDNSPKNSTITGSTLSALEEEPKFTWSHVFESYRGIIVKVEDEAFSVAIPGTHPKEACAFIIVAASVSLGGLVYASRRR